jgi:hypothetical protein
MACGETVIVAGSIGTGGTEFGQRLRMQGGAVVGKAAEDDAVQRRRGGQTIRYGRNRDPRGAVSGKTIDTGGNGGKCNRAEAVNLAQFDGTAIAERQLLVLAAVSAMPDRANGMNYMPGRESVSPGDFGVAGLATMERAAFGKKRWPGRTMDRAIDAAAAEQGAVRGVDDGVNA